MESYEIFYTMKDPAQYCSPPAIYSLNLKGTTFQVSMLRDYILILLQNPYLPKSLLENLLQCVLYSTAFINDNICSLTAQLC